MPASPRPPERAAAFGAVLAALHAAHNVADHVLQTEWQATHKADGPDQERAAPPRWVVAMAGHLASYHGAQLAALLALRAVGVRPRPGRLLAGMVFSAATHGLLDRRWPVRRILEITRHGPGYAQPPVIPESWQPVWRTVDTAPLTVDTALHVLLPARPLPVHGPYLADQALHHACLAIAAAIIIGGRHA